MLDRQASPAEKAHRGPGGGLQGLHGEPDSELPAHGRQRPAVPERRGEYQEKLAARDLTLILTPAEEAPMISADGQLLWRVFENLLSNALKYAMPGTRVYLSCETTDQAVVIAFRNISASP